MISGSLSRTFDSTNWSTPQTITVIAAEDDDASGGTRSVSHIVSGYGSITTAATVRVVVTDTDRNGVTFSPTALTVVEEEAGVSYTVSLHSQPLRNVRITVVNPNSSATAPITVSPATLTFTPTNWATDQLFTVTADSDSDAIGGMLNLSHTIPFSDYEGIFSADLGMVRVTVTDDDTPGVTISPTTLAVTEGEDQTYTVVLNTIPGSDVMVTIEPDSSTMPPITVDPASLILTFTSTAWATPQTVTVTAGQDADMNGGTRTLDHTVSGYTGTTDTGPVVVTSAAAVEVTVTDDDIPGVTISPAELTVTEGEAATYTVVLDTIPDSAVTVTIDPGSSTTAPIMLDPASLTLDFDSTNWATPQPVTVRATEDGDALGGTRTLAHSVSGYTGLVSAVASVEVTVSDNDTPGVTISPGELMVEEGEAATYTVVLDTIPDSDVMVTIAPGSSATAPITLDPASFILTFTSTNWVTPQTVTVRATEDGDALDGTRTLGHTVSGYTGSTDAGSVEVTDAASVVVTVNDNDTPGVTFSPSTPLTVDEEGEAAIYTVVLNTIPDNDVVVTIVPDSSTTAPITIAPASLTFTSTNWATPQPVTVTATEDDDAIDGTRILGHLVSGYGDVATAASVTVEVTDDETPGVTISETTLTITEGEAGTSYTVVLDSNPEGSVMVTIEPDISLNLPITVEPASLTFDSTNWDMPQTVTVTAESDGNTAGGSRTLSHTVSNYPGVTTAALVTVNVADDDRLGVPLSETSLAITEEGGAASYTVVLGNDPSQSLDGVPGQIAVVTIVPGISTTAPITVDPASLTLTFDSTNWDVPQTVTVTAIADDDVIGGMLTLAHLVEGYHPIGDHPRHRLR